MPRRSSPRDLRSSLAASGASDSGQGRLESPLSSAGIAGLEPGGARGGTRSELGIQIHVTVRTQLLRARDQMNSYDAGGMLWKCKLSVYSNSNNNFILNYFFLLTVVL